MPENWVGILGQGDVGITGNVTITGPRPWIDVRAYGLDPAASAATNDAALVAAYNALPASGGDILIPIPGGTAPYDISATWTIGDGSASAISTKRNIRILGGGAGSSASETVISGAVRLRWVGASGGTMVRVAGPISAVIFDGIVFDCNDLAATALDLMHPFSSEFRNLLVVRYRGFAYKISAYTDPVGCAVGANQNVWTNVKCIQPTSGTTASGIQIGPNATGVGIKLNVAQNVYTGCAFVRASNAAAASINLRFTDASVFLSCAGWSEGGALGDALLISVPTGDTVFPGGIVFYNSHLIGAKTVSGTWATGSGIMFLPLPTGDDPTVPVHANFRGLTDAGQFFGTIYGTPFQWATVGGLPTAVATTYYNLIGTPSSIVTENARQIPASVAMDLKRLVIGLTAEPGAGVTRTYTIRKNGGATAVTLAFGPTESGLKAWNGTISFAQNDLISLEEVISGAAAASSMGSVTTRWRETAA